MAAVGAGDTASFERLYALYERRVFQYARTFLRDAALAEEVVIDTMSAVWDGARGFRRSSRVSTWIFGIARHKAIDALRRATPHAKSVALEGISELPSRAPEPDDVAQQAAVRTLMEDAFRRLSPEHREVLYFAFYEDLPYEEIARLLAVPIHTVKTRVHYAKQNLKAHLERHTRMEVLP